MARSPARTPADTRRRFQVAAAIAAAVLVGAVIVAASAGGGDDTRRGAPALPGAAETREMLAGVPQDGVALGDPGAPVTLVEIADAQCPFCRQFSLFELPHVVEDQVRRGRLRVELRLVAFLGPDSERGRSALEAAAAQDRFWDALHVLYYNQGQENTGYMTDAYLRRVLGAVRGLDVDRVMRERTSAAVTRAMGANDRFAARHGARGTPTFLIGRTGRRLRPLAQQVIPAADVARAVDVVAKGR